MKIYRATTPTGFEMQNNELVKFIGLLNLPYESCVVSDCGVGEAECLFKKGNGMAEYLGSEYIRIPGYRRVYVEIGRREPSRIVYLDDSQTRCIRVYIRPIWYWENACLYNFVGNI